MIFIFLGTILSNGKANGKMLMTIYLSELEKVRKKPEPSRRGGPTYERGEIFVKPGKKNSQNPVYATLNPSQKARSRKRSADLAD